MTTTTTTTIVPDKSMENHKLINQAPWGPAWQMDPERVYAFPSHPMGMVYLPMPYVWLFMVD